MKRLAAVLALGLAACSPGGVKPLPPPPTTLPRPSTTAVPDYTDVTLKEVPGRTTTSIALGPGKALIDGVVIGPEGPVPGAVVHLERLVDESFAATDVATLADGTFSVPNLLGGRWRVRAFRPDDLALVKPELFYLGEAETKTLTLRLDRYQGVHVASALAPDPPVTGEPANLLVQVTLQSVDGQGVVRAVPVPGVRVQLMGTGDWRVESGNLQLTDAAGRALWRVRCEAPGRQPLSVLVADNESFALQVPDCVSPPPTTTTSSTTSTTVRGSTTSSSTTAPANPED